MNKFMSDLQNERFPKVLQPLIRPLYQLDQVTQISEMLASHHTFQFDVYATGMFPAVGLGSATEQTSGYRAAWVRDNIHVALAHYMCGDKAAAVRCVAAITTFYKKNRRWFTDIIEGKKSPKNPMNRPHIRFDGNTGATTTEKWPHAQNDALGAFLWLLCQMLQDGTIRLTDDISKLLSVMVRYFETITYWRDEDSGHWEEQRKISASSIGVVNAGIRAYVQLCKSPLGAAAAVDFPAQTSKVLQHGLTAMNQILPAECIQTDPKKERRYDAALLFLVEPFEIVSAETAERIVADVTTHLAGPFGIRRYLRDSYWGPDYRTIPPEKRTIDLSEDIIQRDDFAVAGKEAQWCIFDSILSIHFAKRFQQSGASTHQKQQTHFFNRALSQLVTMPDGTLQLPEAYFVQNNSYVPNDHLPLQWAKANLWRATTMMLK